MNIDHAALMHVLTLVEHHARQAREFLTCSQAIEAEAGAGPRLVIANGAVNGRISVPAGDPRVQMYQQAEGLRKLGLAHIGNLSGACGAFLGLLDGGEQAEEPG